MYITTYNGICITAEDYDELIEEIEEEAATDKELYEGLMNNIKRKAYMTTYNGIYIMTQDYDELIEEIEEEDEELYEGLISNIEEIDYD